MMLLTVMVKGLFKRPDWFGDWPWAFLTTLINNQTQFCSIKSNEQSQDYYSPLKRSLVKEKSGVPRLPPATTSSLPHENHPERQKLESVITELAAKNLQLQKSLETIESDIVKTVRNTNKKRGR